MKKIWVLLLLLVNLNTFAQNKLKDIISIKGVRENPLIGYGLVVGLAGTGDGGGEITNSSLKRMFQKLGLNPQTEITSKNVAAVIVTSKLPEFARMGQKVDVIISSIGDASSLAGGTLLVTPLKGGDGEIYAVASGPISIGGIKQGSKLATTGSIISGATIEREIDINFEKKSSLRLSLNNPDFTTAARIEKSINLELGGKFASAKDSTTIDLIIPTNYQRDVVKLIAIIENIQIFSDHKIRIVVNEKTGTVVAGGNVLLNSVAISHGDLTVEVKNEDGGAGGGGGKGKKQAIHFLEKKATLNDLVKALNAIGAGPEDLISIFQALKKNGALVGELEFI